MAKESNSFEIGLKMEKVWPVPIIGPMLLKQLKTALTTVMKLLLSRLTTKSRPIVIKLYIVKYLRIWCCVSLSNTVSLTCKVRTRFGDKVEMCIRDRSQDPSLHAGQSFPYPYLETGSRRTVGASYAITSSSSRNDAFRSFHWLPSASSDWSVYPGDG